MERLQKVIANSGFTSRRKAEELITSGKVYVNGEVVRELGTKVSGNDDIVINGIHLTKEDKVYFLLNKPRGIISSVSDDKNRKTVVDLIKTDKRMNNKNNEEPINQFNKTSPPYNFYHHTTKFEICLYFFEKIW